jgi:hypothetical protein
LGALSFARSRSVVGRFVPDSRPRCDSFAPTNRQHKTVLAFSSAISDLALSEWCKPAFLVNPPSDEATDALPLPRPSFSWPGSLAERKEIEWTFQLFKEVPDFERIQMELEGGYARPTSML